MHAPTVLGCRRPNTCSSCSVQFETLHYPWIPSLIPYLFKSGESLFNNYYSVCLCDVTLSVYPHLAGLKNMPGHGGNRNLWNTSLCQLSYAVRSVRVCDISELSLVPSISV
jgi:hypothetical protein